MHSLNLIFLGTLVNVDHFSFEENTSSWWSCSALIGGRMMIFGGELFNDHEKQISEVDSCHLKLIGYLPMGLSRGACNTLTMDFTEETMLCFSSEWRHDEDLDKICHRYGYNLKLVKNEH